VSSQTSTLWLLLLPEKITKTYKIDKQKGYHQQTKVTFMKSIHAPRQPKVQRPEPTRAWLDLGSRYIKLLFFCNSRIDYKLKRQ